MRTGLYGQEEKRVDAGPALQVNASTKAEPSLQIRPEQQPMMLGAKLG
jgi:hypothetical protein